MGFTGFYRVLPGFYLVLPSFTLFYRVLPCFTEFYLVLPSFTEFYRVLPSFTEFYRVLPSFNRLTTDSGYISSKTRCSNQDNWLDFYLFNKVDSIVFHLSSIANFYLVLPGFT